MEPTDKDELIAYLRRHAETAQELYCQTFLKLMESRRTQLGAEERGQLKGEAIGAAYAIMIAASEGEGGAEDLALSYCAYRRHPTYAFMDTLYPHCVEAKADMDSQHKSNTFRSPEGTATSAFEGLDEILKTPPPQTARHELDAPPDPAE